MAGAKYNSLLSNKFITKYKYSLANISSSIKNSNLERDQYNYLEKSVIPTQHFQKSLQKLAIPKLEVTVSRYLTALKPLLNATEYERAEKVARHFEANEGKALDQEIRDLDAADKNGNYISEPWFDMYLRARDSIVLNFNPFIAFKPFDDKGQMNQAVRATNLLISSARFAQSLKFNQLKPEIFHINPAKSDTPLFARLMSLLPESVAFYGAYMFNAYPLDMSQYFRLFNSSRVPAKDKDYLVTDPTKKHILVVHRGHFYTFDVIDEKTNQLLKPAEIYACILNVFEQSKARGGENKHPLGVLTSENRDTWAGVRERLVELGNGEQLAAIDSALYCIALDDDVETDEPNELAHEFLYGNPANRWFDKNYTLIVNKSGHAALNFEHSWGDGVAVLRLFNELFADASKRAFVTPKTKPELPSGEKYVRALEFKLDDSVLAAIEQAQRSFEAATEKIKMHNFENDQFGRDFVKPYKLSPDSLMQSAMQIAYYKVYGKHVATYESASTSAFKLGRTETVRPVTEFTNQLSQHLAKNNSTKPDNAQHVYKLLQQCTSKHNTLVKEGAMGQGFDRHLFAMKYHLATRKPAGTPVPDFYQTDEYRMINHNTISTSTLAYPTILLGGFAPVVPDGFGLGYRILDKSLGVCMSSYSQSELTKYSKELADTYDMLFKLLKNVKPPSKKDK